VGAELKQPQLGRAQSAADGEPRAESKSGSLPGNHRHVGQTVGARQLIERAARGWGDTALTEPRTAWAGWAVRARRQSVRLLQIGVLHMSKPPSLEPQELGCPAHRACVYMRSGSRDYLSWLSLLPRRL